MSKPKNIYAVKNEKTGETSYVRAKGLQTAIDHVAKAAFTGRLLKGGDVADAYESGAEIETAGEQAQDDTPEPQTTTGDTAPNPKEDVSDG